MPSLDCNYTFLFHVSGQPPLPTNNTKNEKAAVENEKIETISSVLPPTPLEDLRPLSKNNLKRKRILDSDSSDDDNDDQQNDEHDGNSNEVEHNQDITKNGNDDGDKNDETMEEEFDPIASAVASIMGPDGNFDIRKSPVKPIVPTSFMPRNAHPIAMPPLVPNGQHHNISASKTNSSTSLLRSFRPQHHATHSSAGNFLFTFMYLALFTNLISRKKCLFKTQFQLLHLNNYY